MNSKVKMVALDLDDTLYLERDYVRSGFRAVDAHLRLNHGIAGFLGAASDIFDTGVRGLIFNEALLTLRQEPDPGLVGSLVSIYRAHDPAISLLPDVLPFLGWARARYFVAVLTDGYTIAQRQKLRALGLPALVDEIVVCDELGSDCWKPSCVPFDRLLASSGCQAAEAVYVGDNPGKDVAGPRAAGWRSVLVRRVGAEHHGRNVVEPGPDALVEDLAGVRQVLEGWA